MMHFLVFLIYPALLACVFFGVRFSGAKTCHEKPLGSIQTKAVCGILSVCIILHHLSQKAAIQLPAKDPARIALEPFREVGFLFVAYFFFCSGFGLFKSFSSKPDYLKGFLAAHMTPLLVTFFITDSLFQYARISRKAPAFPASTYSWFVFVLLLFYIGFYLCARFAGKYMLPGIFAIALIWCILCRITYTQTYWYNSISAFPLGVWFAKHEQKLLTKLQKKYPLTLAVSVLVTVALVYMAGNDMRLSHLLDKFITYSLVRDIQTFLQLSSSIAFPILISVLSMKIQIRNKVLAFLGAMTLETYLIHVLFVELFCSRFIGYLAPFFYIKNPVLYLLIVITLTMPSAFLLKLIRNKLATVILKGEDTPWAFKILKSAATVSLIIIVLAFAYFSISSHLTTSRLKSAMEDYKNKYETFTEVDGKQISAYVTGSGEHTFLLLSDAADPAPSMLLRPMAEHLSQYGKVIVPDPFGSGYSDSTDDPRTSRRLAEEMHKVAKTLNDGKPVILFSCTTSGIFATTYLQSYPDDVEGLIGYDMVSSAVVKEVLDEPSLTDEQIFYGMKTSLKRGRIGHKLLNLSGFIRMDLVTYNEAFMRDVMKDHIEQIDEMFIANMSNPESIDMQAFMVTQARSLSDFTYDPTLPVMLLSTSAANSDPTKKPIKMYQKLITNEDCQSIKLISGDSLSIYYQPKPILEQVSAFMKTNY